MEIENIESIENLEVSRPKINRNFTVIKNTIANIEAKLKRIEDKLTEIENKLK